MTNKLLHERLRDISSGVDCEETRKVLDFSVDDEHRKRECAWCSKGALEAIADEMERCYVPRPVDAEGNPWKVEDPCVWSGAEYEVAGFDGQGYMGLYSMKDDEYLFAPAKDVERPAKVLDADGVPIKVGDVVWSQSGNKGTVKGCNGIDSTAYVEWDDGRWSPNILCMNLTHKEPDSLEKLLDDMETCNFVNMTRQIEQWVDRLTAIMERDA